MSSLAEYLAKNYLTADHQPGKKSKKRKRTAADVSSTGFVIADDDSLDWDIGSRTATARHEHDDPRAAALAAGRTADFRRKKTSEWKSINTDGNDGGGGGGDEADAIIRSAAAENAARAEAEDVDDAPMELDTPKKGGLQSAKEVQREAERKRRAERKRIEQDVRSGEATAQETIYRDASGRRIDVALKRAEARKKADEVERKKRQEEDEARGDVQIAMREQRRKELEEAKYMTVARTADDEEMNDAMKDVQRWNDPAAGFLIKKQPNKSSSRHAQSRAPSKPTYQGAFEPNRYGIRPGSRWDGVDRANGFEKKWFAARNKKRDVKALEYQWEMDE